MRPLLIAHRGDGKNFPENTIEAFASALDKGADGIECDVHFSDKSELIVVHDFLYDTKRKYPLLSEVLKRFAKKYFIEIEVKSFEYDIVRAIAKQIDIYKPNQYELTSSELPLLQFIRKAFPKANIGMIFNSYFLEEWMTQALIKRKVLGYMNLTGANIVHIKPEDISKELVDALHSENFKVHSHVYTADVGEYKKMAGLGVDKLTFDDIALLENLSKK